MKKLLVPLFGVVIAMGMTGQAEAQYHHHHRHCWYRHHHRVCRWR